MKYMVDANIINRLIDGSLSTEDLPGDAKIVATHIQIDELSRTPDPERKARLLARFRTLVDEVMPTESTVLSVSRLSLCKLSDGHSYQELKVDLDSLNGGKPNNIADALIAEAAIKNGYELITADNDLAQVAKKRGCVVRRYP